MYCLLVDSIAADLERALAAPGEALAPAALAIAQLEHPRLDPRPYLRQLGEFGREAARRLEGLAPRRERIAALNRFVFGTLGFAGNSAQHLDPRNSFLNDVIDRRLGIPITLSIVYIEIGRRAGLSLRGIGFPGHFLVREDDETGEPLVIDAFAGGRMLAEKDRVALLREHVSDQVAWHPSLLDPAERREIVLRMLANLKRAYVTLRSFPQARRAADLLVALDPSAITELRDRGLLSYHLQDFPAALRDLESYLRAVTRHEPPSEAASAAPGDQEDEDDTSSDEHAEIKDIWEHVKNLRRRVASFN